MLHSALLNKDHVTPIPPVTHFLYLFTLFPTLFISTFHNITFFHSIFRPQISPITTYDRVSAIQTYFNYCSKNYVIWNKCLIIKFYTFLKNHNLGSIRAAQCGNKLQWDHSLLFSLLFAMQCKHHPYNC